MTHDIDDIYFKELEAILKFDYNNEDSRLFSDMTLLNITSNLGHAQLYTIMNKNQGLLFDIMNLSARMKYSVLSDWNSLIQNASNVITDTSRPSTDIMSYDEKCQLALLNPIDDILKYLFVDTWYAALVLYHISEYHTRTRI